MEQDQDNTGVSRGQNQLHLLPEDWSSADAAIAPMLDRLDAEEGRAQLVVVTNDAEAAAGIGRRLGRAAGARGLRILAATDARRAARVQRAAAGQIVVGAPSALVSLLQSAALKLDGVRTIALAWVEDLPKGETAALETLMAEMPKDAGRLVIANEATAAVEQLVERYARRARRMQPAAEDAAPVSLSFIATSDAARPAALRRVLDAVDPESALVVARDAESRAEVEGVLRTLGYDGRSNAVRIGDGGTETAALVVVYDLPSTGDELRRAATAAAGAGGRVVALVTPRQISALKRLAGGAVTPLSLPEAAARARSREESLRDELRGVLTGGQFSRELLAIESLLSDYDGAEIAAAALRLLEMERAKPRGATGSSAAAAMTRLFLNVGEMDGVRAGDLVGAITNEAGVSKAELGRVEVRERGSTVEVATPVANAVIAKLHGVTIKGRRAFVKVDEERPHRERSGGPGDRPGGRGRGAPIRRDREGGGGRERGGPRKR